MKNKILKRILSAVLCLLMVMGSVLMLASCEFTIPEETEAEGSEQAPTSDKVTVVRAIKSMEVGEKLVRANLQEALVDKDQVPEGAITTIKEVANKFLKVPLVVGDYIYPEKISNNLQFLKDGVSELMADYVIVTDYTSKATNASDLSDAIQKAIDENPNKTIYFPDAQYRIAKPIKTSADPAKAVSFRFSTYAIINADGKAEDWPEGSAMFQLGALDSDNISTKYNFAGGVINANGIAGLTAISVDGGTVLMNNVSVKEASFGVVIQEKARADVDSVVIIGAGADHAVAVVMKGEESTLTNMRMTSVLIGVKLTGGNNVLRNIHPLASSTIKNRWSTGFYDISSGNFYDVCYSDQFAVGFYMGKDTRSVYNGCFLYWYASRESDEIMGGESHHYGFYAAEEFNSIIRDCRVTLNRDHEASDMTYLKVEKGAVYDCIEEGAQRATSHEGDGVIVYPRGNHGNDEHLSDWKNYFCKTDTLG